MGNVIPCTFGVAPCSPPVQNPSARLGGLGCGAAPGKYLPPLWLWLAAQKLQWGVFLEPCKEKEGGHRLSATSTLGIDCRSLGGCSSSPCAREGHPVPWKGGIGAISLLCPPCWVSSGSLWVDVMSQDFSIGAGEC